MATVREKSSESVLQVQDSGKGIVRPKTQTLQRQMLNRCASEDYLDDFHMFPDNIDEKMNQIRERLHKSGAIDSYGQLNIAPHLQKRVNTIVTLFQRDRFWKGYSEGGSEPDPSTTLTHEDIGLYEDSLMELRRRYRQEVESKIPKPRD